MINETMPGIFDEDQTEAETVDDGPLEESTEEIISDDNTDTEKSHEQSDDVDTSSQETGDDTKPELKQVKLALDDEEFELELPEKIAETVKNGILMEHKFRKDTQALAEQRRQFEAELAAKKQEQESVITELASQLLFMQNELESPEMQELKQYDRAEYDRKRMDYQDRFESYKKFVDSTYNEHKKETDAQAQERQKVEFDKLNTLIPEWLDVKTKEQDAKQMFSYAESVGFTADEMKSIGQARMMRVFRDASKWNEAKSNIQSKKSKPSVTSVKASSKPTTAQTKPLEDYFYGGG